MNVTKNDIDERLLNADKALVLFHADWCPFCRRFKPVFEEYRDKAKFTLVEAKIDDYGNPLWDKFKIEVIPTVIAFKNGKEIARRDGKEGIGLMRSDFESLIAELG